MPLMIFVRIKIFDLISLLKFKIIIKVLKINWKVKPICETLPTMD